MPSLVLELQAQALDPNIRTPDLLRKAKVVASKLHLTDISEWVDYEMNGYPEDVESVPQYRHVYGEIRGKHPLRGWERIHFEDTEEEQDLSTNVVRMAISELEEIAVSKDSSIMFPATGILLRRLSYATDAGLFTSRSKVSYILDMVRNKVLDWTLLLEREGILGDGLSFSPAEVSRASDPSVHVHIGHIENLGSLSVTHIATINVDQRRVLEASVSAISTQIEALPSEERDDAQAKIAELENELGSPKPSSSKLRSILQSIGNAAKTYGPTVAKTLIEESVKAGVRALTGTP